MNNGAMLQDRKALGLGFSEMERRALSVHAPVGRGEACDRWNVHLSRCVPVKFQYEELTVSVVCVIWG